MPTYVCLAFLAARFATDTSSIINTVAFPEGVRSARPASAWNTIYKRGTCSSRLPPWPGIDTGAHGALTVDIGSQIPWCKLYLFAVYGGHKIPSICT